MDVVIGSSPLALGLAEHLAARGPAVLLGAEPVAGPFAWRWFDVHTGRGLADALRPARRTFVVLDDAFERAGLLAVARPGLAPRAVVLTGLVHDDGVQELLRHLGDASQLRVGPTWGPTNPLVSAWARTLTAGGVLWIPDSPPVRARSMTDAALAAVAAADRPRSRWTLGTPDGATLPELAAHLAVALGARHRSVRVPLRVATWRAGVPEQHVRGWLDAPAVADDTPGWTLPKAAAPATWAGSPSRWRNGA